MAVQRTYRGIIAGVLLAVGVIAGAAFFAREAILSSQFDLITYLDDSVGITPSSPVLLHGIAIGHVRRLTLSGSKDPSRAVRIDMRFSRAYLKDIPNDSTVAIVASNLLGDKSFDITRGTASQTIIPGSELHSLATQDIGAVLKRGSEPLRKVDTIMARVDRILNAIDNSEGSAGLVVNDHTLQRRFEGILRNTAEIQNRARNGNGIVFHIADLRNEVRKPQARFDGMMADFNKLNSTTVTPLMQQTTDISHEGQQLFNQARNDPRPGELMKQARQTSDKAVALDKRFEARLNDPALGKELDALSAEYKSFSADFGKHPLHFIHFYIF